MDCIAFLRFSHIHGWEQFCKTFYVKPWYVLTAYCPVGYSSTVKYRMQMLAALVIVRLSDCWIVNMTSQPVFSERTIWRFIMSHVVSNFINISYFGANYSVSHSNNAETLSWHNLWVDSYEICYAWRKSLNFGDCKTETVHLGLQFFIILPKIAK